MEEQLNTSKYLLVAVGDQVTGQPEVNKVKCFKTNNTIFCFIWVQIFKNMFGFLKPIINSSPVKQ